ncbi:hypothetical protein KQI82_12675 [Oscillibacter sp. MSJ-2]|uniref:DUF2007 domain-containing protein n=1 Tax=Dysosmobacter acutus TaxID=2841504 RepID=A0ABS6FBV4_9FIRM|nr:hypothetical protein [Dysosmobacter acutus]MBU5627764.1 hypothetical protein [Dysosmobacter acutus]
MNDPTTWGRAEGGLYDRWPKEEGGAPEKAVFLVDLPDSGAIADMTVAQLEAYGIPVMKRYEKEGGLGRVILGFSGYGASLYVPASRLEEAKGLLEAAAPAEEE